MNIDQAKVEAKALVSALKALGVGDITTSRALEVVARMNGFRNWQTAQSAGGVGQWNLLQRTVYLSYPDSDLLPLHQGQAYVACGDPLFEAMMHVAGSQPLSRVVKTLETWADETDTVQMQVRHQIDHRANFDVSRLMFPKGLAPSFDRFLRMEVSEEAGSWTEVASRLEKVRRDLFTVSNELRNLQQDTGDDIMLLASHNADPQTTLAVRVPASMTRTQARHVAQEVLTELQDRSHDAPGNLFDFGPAEAKVRLAQRGLEPLAEVFVGPTWN